MAVSTLSKSDPRQPKLYRGGSDVNELTYGSDEANSMTFTVRHFVYSNAGAITDAEPSTDILGLAGKAATNVTSGNVEIPVYVIQPGDRLLIQVEDGSGNPEASDTTCVVGTAYGIKAFSANVPSRIDSSNASNDQFTYLGPYLDATGASSYWGWFTPNVDILQSSDGA